MSGALLRAVSFKHCARIILVVTSHLLNSQEVLIRLQLLSLIAAWPRMTQPWLRIHFPNWPLANGRSLRSHLRVSAEGHALRAQPKEFFQWSCPWSLTPCPYSDRARCGCDRLLSDAQVCAVRATERSPQRTRAAGSDGAVWSCSHCARRRSPIVLSPLLCYALGRRVRRQGDPWVA
jgi:hypothetical protein